MHEIGEFEKELIETSRILGDYAIYLTKSPEQADDLLQETLLRILTNIDKYEEQGCFKAWAKSIMKNLFLNSITSNQKHRSTFVNGYDYINDDNFHPLVSESDCKYSKEEIYKAISLLPARYAQMITLQMTGYKYEEIAKQMNISIGCVKSTIFSAKTRLRKILGN